MRSRKGRQSTQNENASRMICGGQRECQWFLGNWGLSQVGGENTKSPITAVGGLLRTRQNLPVSASHSSQPLPQIRTHEIVRSVPTACTRRWGRRNDFSLSEESHSRPLRTPHHDDAGKSSHGEAHGALPLVVSTAGRDSRRLPLSSRWLHRHGRAAQRGGRGAGAGREIQPAVASGAGGDCERLRTPSSAINRALLQ